MSRTVYPEGMKRRRGGEKRREGKGRDETRRALKQNERLLAGIDSCDLRTIVERDGHGVRPRHFALVSRPLVYCLFTPRLILLLVSPGPTTDRFQTRFNASREGFLDREEKCERKGSSRRGRRRYHSQCFI